MLLSAVSVAANQFELMEKHRPDFVKISRAHPESVHEVTIALMQNNMVTSLYLQNKIIFRGLLLISLLLSFFNFERMYWKKWC